MPDLPEPAGQRKQPAQATNPRQTASGAYEILSPALMVGACSGTLGLAIGSVSGVLRSQHPVLFALFSGGQWFLLGSSYWLTRSTILQARPDTSRPQASAIAGVLSGSIVAGLTRGRKNIVPAAVMIGLFGYAGQRVYDARDRARATAIVQAAAQQARSEPPQSSVQAAIDSLAASKWSPVTKLTPQEHLDRLREQLLRVDAQLALVDEDLDRLRRSREHERASQSGLRALGETGGEEGKG